jgi:hypothetical protein
VEFKPVLGWSTPPNRIITIIANQSTAINGAYNLKSAVNEIPKIFKVWPPFPNPMNPATTIRYEISSECNVSLIIYDIYGRRIAVLEDGIHPAGIYNVTWNGKDSNDTLTSSGVYFYCLKAGKSINTGKIIFLK